MNSLIETVEVVGDVFSLRTNEDLDGKRERVEESSVGVDGGVLFFFREKIEVDGGGFKNEGN